MRDPFETITIADVEKEYDSQSQRLVFSPKIETLYTEENRSQQRRSVIINWLIGCGLFDAFLLSDYFVSNDDFPIYVIGRLGLMTPACFIILYLLRSADKYYQLIVCLLPLAFSASLSGMLILSHGDYRSNYLPGDILLIICGYVISRPKLIYAVPTAILQCILFEITVQWTSIVATSGKISSLFFCISGGVVTIMTAYGLEQATRRAFLLGLRVRLLNRELGSMAMLDPLTGLGNRRLFEDRTKRFWDQPSTAVKLASLILIDIDMFKLFNDNYGHSAGDLCLSTLGRRIAAEMRDDNDVAVRFGGEEIIIFLPDTDFSEARRIAEKIRLAIGNAGIPHPVIAPDAVVTASLGVATAATADCTAAELVIRADLALYGAKHNGRNRVWPPFASLQNDIAWQPSDATAWPAQRRAEVPH